MLAATERAASLESRLMVERERLKASRAQAAASRAAHGFELEELRSRCSRMQEAGLRLAAAAAGPSSPGVSRNGNGDGDDGALAETEEARGSAGEHRD